MANTYYDSQLTAGEIEEVLEAINGILTQANNGKVLAINNGKLEARSVQWSGGSAVVQPLTVTANGDYTPVVGVDGFDEVHVSVPNSYTLSDEGKVVSNGALVAQTTRASQITQNGTYDTTLNNEVTVNVSGGGSAVVQPLSVTQNGTYNPPSGVDGYAPVTVNVSGGGTPSRETIIDPNIMAAIGSYNTNTVSKQYVPLISRTQSGTSSAANINNNAVHRTGYFTGGFIFPQKIKAGDYSKIYADVEVTQYGTGWRQCKLYLSSTFALQNSGDGDSIIKTVWLATQDLTSEQINAQAGVVINSTSQYSLSRQVVEIDISSVNTDFYAGFFNCDENIWVYSLYLE